MLITYMVGQCLNTYLIKTFKFDNKITIDQILQHSDTSYYGFIVECDLEFPKHLHNKFKQFPRCPREGKSENLSKAYTTCLSTQKLVYTV